MAGRDRSGLVGAAGVDAVRTEVEEMLFCRTTIKRGGDREGGKMEEEEKNRESTVEMGKDHEMGRWVYLWLLQPFFKSSELSRSRGHGQGTLGIL